MKDRPLLGGLSAVEELGLDCDSGGSLQAPGAGSCLGGEQCAVSAAVLVSWWCLASGEGITDGLILLAFT